MDDNQHLTAQRWSIDFLNKLRVAPDVTRSKRRNDRQEDSPRVRKHPRTEPTVTLSTRLTKVMFKNIRGFKGSLCALRLTLQDSNEDDRPDIIVLVETMALQPGSLRIPGYHTKKNEPARRKNEKKKGRPQGGFVVRVKNSYGGPVGFLRTGLEPEDCAVVIIGDQRSCDQCVALVAFYRQPVKQKGSSKVYFDKLQRVISHLQAKHFITLLVGDANGHTAEDTAYTNKAEDEAGKNWTELTDRKDLDMTRLTPVTSPRYTYYKTTKEDYKRSDSFMQLGQTRSIIDHAAVQRKGEKCIERYWLDLRHIQSDHAGLRFDMKQYIKEEGRAIVPKPRGRRERLRSLGRNERTYTSS